MLRVATYNIHKGVRGLGPARRLEIHHIGLGIAALKADVVCLQEVRLFHHRDAQHFDHTYLGWPPQGQAAFLAPEGYSSAYRSNAVTKGGEHGNALLTRLAMGAVGHEDVSDHRFEQRGLLHVPLRWQGRELHVIVAHFGLIHASRMRQTQRLGAYLARAVPADAPVLVAGDFNDWPGQLDAPMHAAGLHRASAPGDPSGGRRTFPSQWPVWALDRVYLRGLRCLSTEVPRGAAWARMSDHLPLLVELDWA
jgi:endonuclease/exonuclease/phosphatase family metal-dependent hydrolase